MAELRVIFLDAGQGDCTLIVYPDKSLTLVDCGSIKNKRIVDQGLEQDIKRYAEQNNKTIDNLVLTHPDQDHYNLILKVLKDTGITVRHIYYGGAPELYGKQVAAFIKKQAGESPGIGFTNQPNNKLSRSDVNVYILAVNQSGNKGAKDPLRKNRNSIVLMLKYQDVRIFLMGDADAAVEQFIIDSVKQQGPAKLLRGEDGQNVLKLGHHGSAHSSGRPWIKATYPRTIFVSSDTRMFNGTGMPGATLVNRIKKDLAWRLEKALPQDHSYVQYTDKDGGTFELIDAKKLEFCATLYQLQKAQKGKGFESTGGAWHYIVDETSQITFEFTGWNSAIGKDALNAAPPLLSAPHATPKTSAEATPMTLAALKSLLAQLAPKSPFSLSDTALGITAVQELFEQYLPNKTLNLSAATADVTTLTVYGTFTIAGYVDMPAVVTFLADATATDVSGIEISAVVPAWDIQTSFLSFSGTCLQQFGFHKLRLVLRAAPDEDGVAVPAYGIGADFPFVAKSGLVNLSTVALLSPGGDFWYSLNGTFSPGIALNGYIDLHQFAKRVDFSIPPAVPVAVPIRLTALRLIIDRATSTIVILSIEVQLADRWPLIEDLFSFSEICTCYTVTYPTLAPVLSRTLTCKMDFPGHIVLAAGFYLDPTLEMSAEIEAPSSLGPILQRYLPDCGLGDFQLTYGLAALDVESLAYTLHLNIADPWTLPGGLLLKDLALSIDGTGGSGGSGATGGIAATFEVADVAFTLFAAYLGTALGWQFAGQLPDGQSLSIGKLADYVKDKFNIPIPEVLNGLFLRDLEIVLTTAAPSFLFTCTGDLAVCGTRVTLSPLIALSWNGQRYDSQFSATLSLTSGQSNLTFAVSFLIGSSTAFTAVWQKEGTLQLGDFLAALKLPAVDVPPELDLSLKSAELTYDTRSEILILAADSTRFGRAVLVVTGPPRDYFFTLAVNGSVPLSALPLIGSLLAAEQTISINAIQAVVSSSAITKRKAALINNYITPLGPSYPLLPSAGTAAKVAICMSIDLGGTTLPMSQGASSAPGQSVIGPQGGSGADGPIPITPGNSSDGTTWFEVQKSFGPLTIARIGVQYRDAALWFLLDASLLAGRIRISLFGASVGISIGDFKPVWNLLGLGLDYENPPLLIGGGLLNVPPIAPLSLEFAGSAIIETGALSITALGEYADVAGHPSMFLFAMSTAALGGPPPLFITGLAAGLGYNSSFTPPSLEDLPYFPLLAALPNSTNYDPRALGAPQPTPLQALSALSAGSPPWIAPAVGSVWLAAGVTFTSFELISSQALLLIDVADTLSLSLLGTASARFPQLGDVTYAQVELCLDVKLLPAQGVFLAQALLSAGSFLFSSECLLRGGFAFAVFYDPSPQAGDFVLTLGGYAPRFDKPAYYPSVPPVEFHWQLDSRVDITGTAYLALTPSGMMLGGELAMNFQAGNLSAWIDAYADVTLNWKPFHFEAEFGITIGASYRLDLLFATVTITAELGATLELFGPPTGGQVTVEWDIISFTIPFGSSRPPPPNPLTWSDMQAMLPNTGTADAPNILQVSAVCGLVNTAASPAVARLQATTDDPPPWIVRGGNFTFTTHSPVPASQATAGSQLLPGAPLDVRPLQMQALDSLHTLTVFDESGCDVTSGFDITALSGNVPTSLWGPLATGLGIASADAQLLCNQLIGLRAVVKPPIVGNSVGAINVSKALSTFNLELHFAVLPLSATAPPVGDAPRPDDKTVAAIIDPRTGIASPKMSGVRGQIYEALQSIGYAPPENQPLDGYAKSLVCSLADEPLIVSATRSAW
jgi:beta-lactamase superfamily II metal-dependent hydrolase